MPSDNPISDAHTSSSSSSRVEENNTVTRQSLNGQNYHTTASEDLFSATSRLSKAVTSTASALINNSNSGNSNNILLNSTHYQKAIYDTLIGPHKQQQNRSSNPIDSTISFSSRNKKKRAPSEFLRLSFSKDEISYRAITHISDDLLNEIPKDTQLQSDDNFSLFQGFNASIPQVDEELYIFKELNLDGLKFSESNNNSGQQKLLTIESDEKNRAIIEKKLNNPLPIDISSKKIKQCKSVKNLNTYKQKILKKMNYLEVKKNLSSNEIKEIDAKIAKLTAMRDTIFSKVAKIEKDEIYLEGYIQEIGSKIEQLHNGIEEEDEEDEEEDQKYNENANNDQQLKRSQTNKITQNEDKIKLQSRKSLASKRQSLDKLSRSSRKTSFEKNRSEITNHKPHRSILGESGALNNDKYKHDVNLDDSESTSSEDYAMIDNEHQEPQPDDDDKSYLLSQSIYTSLQKKPPKFNKISHKNRKIKPTLQNYYSSGTQISSFNAHEQSISCFDFDYPFGTLVSASLDATVRVWDLSTHKCLTLLEGHDMYVRCMQMDDNLLVTGSEDSNLKLWDLSKVENKEYEEDDEVVVNNAGNEDEEENDNDPCVYTFESHIDEVTALHFDNLNLISGSSDRTIRQWDMKTGHCLQTLDVLWVTNNSTNVTSSIDASFSYQGYSNVNGASANSNSPFIGALQCYSAALASGTADGIVRLWDLRSGEAIRSLSGHTGPITCLQFDDKSLITGSEDSTIKVWDLRMGKIQENLTFGGGAITSLQFDPKRIVFTNGNDYINIYDRQALVQSSMEDKVRQLKARVGDEAPGVAKFARYKEGYLVGGYSSGIVKTWAA